MITDNEARDGRTYAYHLLRYMPNLVRDEWVNIGVLVFDPYTGERRLRMIEEPEEYARVRRLHPQADEGLLRVLRDNLENRFATARQLFSGNGHEEGNARADWLKLLGKWDDTLSNVLQLAPQKGVRAAEFTFPADPMRLDYGYRRNGTRGFVQAISVSRAPRDTKEPTDELAKRAGPQRP
jgi:hypothetical protein